MPEFSNDEINVMCIYDTGSREGLIGTLHEKAGSHDRRTIRGAGRNAGA